MKSISKHPILFGNSLKSIKWRHFIRHIEQLHFICRAIQLQITVQNGLIENVTVHTQIGN